jgi:ribulose-phosphate 3-epimerase
MKLNPGKVYVAPSILSADFSRLGEEVQAVEKAGADIIHIDVMDGHFVPNITIGPVVVKGIRKMTHLPFDVHLMIENPDNYIDEFAKAGADLISVHVEACPHIHRTIQHIRSLHVVPGVVLNPGTPAISVESILPFIDFVLLMSVNPGFGGQSFIPEVLPKARELKRMMSEVRRDVLIEMDGGISEQNATLARDAGVDIFVAGTAVFSRSSYLEAIRTIRDQAMGSVSI